MSFTAAVYGWIGIAAATFVALLVFRVRAPYGRYASRRWGPTLPHRIGWVAMELVSPIAFLGFFFAGDAAKTVPALLFAALWAAHYANRAIVDPFRQRSAGRRMPVLIAGAAGVFNAVNGYLNGHYLGEVASPYPVSWLADPRFLSGAAVFAAGAAINLHADRILRGLRRAGERGYSIPHGGLFRWISCPNYLGEIIEWIGFALLTWSPAALSFAVWTVANLLPRALSHHEWYRERFPDYPRERKALIPGIL